MDALSEEARVLMKDVSKFDTDVKKMIKKFNNGDITEVEMLNEFIIHLSKKLIDEENAQLNNDLQTW